MARVRADGAARDHVDEGLDPPARAPLAAAAPAGLRQRDRRVPALPLEGEGDDRRAGLLRGDSRPCCWRSGCCGEFAARRIRTTRCKPAAESSGSPPAWPVPCLSQFTPDPAHLPDFGQPSRDMNPLSSDTLGYAQADQVRREGPDLRRQGRLGRVRHAEQHQARQRRSRRSGPTCRSRSPGRR